jgi:hypothetical protein
MKKIDAERLDRSGSSMLLVDLTSLGSLLAEAENLQLALPEARSYYRQKLKTSHAPTLALFEVLSNFICFDQFFVDYRALYSYQRAPELLAMLDRLKVSRHFSGIEFSSKSYRDAVDNVIALKNSILENAPKSLLKAEGGTLENLFGTDETKWVDDATLKDMYDRRYFLERPDFPSDLPRNFAETGMSVERLFVYLEVARSLDLPASLARTKYGALEAVGKKARAIANAIDRELTRQALGSDPGVGMVQQLVESSALPGVELSAPLLPSHILRVAEERSCSIMSAVRAIRVDPAAESFRNYLWKHRKAFDPVFAGDHLKAQSLRKELSDIGKRIAKAKSPTGVFNDMTNITLNLSNIPVLGALLKIIGKRKITVPVMLPRRPPMYEVFMARWFR